MKQQFTQTKAVGEWCFHRRDQRPFTALSGHFNGARHLSLEVVPISERDTVKPEIECWN